MWLKISAYSDLRFKPHWGVLSSIAYLPIPYRHKSLRFVTLSYCWKARKHIVGQMVQLNNILHIKARTAHYALNIHEVPMSELWKVVAIGQLDVQAARSHLYNTLHVIEDWSPAGSAVKSPLGLARRRALSSRETRSKTARFRRPRR